MVAIALASLLASLAGGVALSAYVASRRETDADLHDQLAARYVQLACEFPEAAPAAADCLACDDPGGRMRDVVLQANDALAGRPCGGEVGAVVRGMRRDETREFLAGVPQDCALRRSLADALRDADARDARDAMLALDHVLEVADDMDGLCGARDMSVNFADCAPAVTTVGGLMAALEVARAAG